MIDMCQADRSLRMRPLNSQHRMCWTFALSKAAKEMGYTHYTDVPNGTKEDEKLRANARRIQGGNPE